MKTQIRIKIIKDDNGTLVGKAVGYPGVIASGKTKEEVLKNIKKAWLAMAVSNFYDRNSGQVLLNKNIFGQVETIELDSITTSI